jgi:AcrR family transcriptional regulator
MDAAEQGKSPPRRRLSPDERREQLLDSALQLAAAGDLTRVSVAEIADRAGVSEGLLYHYFPTKDDFLLAVLDRSQTEMDEGQVRDPELSALEQFDRNLDSFLRFVDAHAAGYLAVVNARGSEPRVQKLIETRRTRRLDELVALTALRWDVPREVARTPLLVAAIDGWLGFSEGVIVRWLRDREIGRDEVHQLLRRALLEASDCALSLTTTE